MILYLDTSALVKLYVAEDGSSDVRRAVENADRVATSAIAYVEARAAFARKRREGGLLPLQHGRIIRDLDNDWGRYLRIDLTDVVIRRAASMAERHRLRAYDAVHLASAGLLKDRLSGPVVFAGWDDALQTAARREHLDILRPPRPLPPV